jgi:hypothetical protein
MPHRIRELAVVVACAVAAIGGCGGQTAAHKEPLLAIVSLAIPAAAQEITNPLRGQDEDLLFGSRGRSFGVWLKWAKTDAGEVGQTSGGSKPHSDLTRAATPDFGVADGPESGP